MSTSKNKITTSLTPKRHDGRGYLGPKRDDLKYIHPSWKYAFYDFKSSKKNLSKVHKVFDKSRRRFHVDKDFKIFKHPSKGLQTHDDRVFESLSDDTVETTMSFMNPLQVYRFRLGGYTTLSQSSGVINTFLASDPSASGWNSPEWATLSALFSEFRLVELGVRVVRNYNVTVTSGIAALAIASNLGTAGNPGSYAALCDNADVSMYSYVETGRYSDGKCGQVHVMKATDINYSEMTTPTTAPYAGAPGSIQFYSDNTLAAGTLSNVFQVFIWGIYDFRIRV